MEQFCYLSPFCIILQISSTSVGPLGYLTSHSWRCMLPCTALWCSSERRAVCSVSRHFSLRQELKISLHVSGALFQYHTDQCLWSCTLLCCEWVLCIGESNCLLLLWYFTALQLFPDMPPRVWSHSDIYLHICGAVDYYATAQWCASEKQDVYCFSAVCNYCRRLHICLHMCGTVFRYDTVQWSDKNDLDERVLKGLPQFAVLPDLKSPPD